MSNNIEKRGIIQNLYAHIAEAHSRFVDWEITGEDWQEPSWNIESCFLHLLAVMEALDLPDCWKIAYQEYCKAKDSKKGFVERGRDPDGDTYSIVIGRMRCFANALERLLPGERGTTVRKDLLQLVRDMIYVITDTKIFPSVPRDENEVHVRIEAILKCVYPDLKHKPTLTKQIKNFQPDTGIPSIETLIEYKFLSRKEDIGPIADQLLADTRGYSSRDWSRFLYIIYETHRFRTEKEWNQLLRESGVPENTTAVVLSGEPIQRAQHVRSRDQYRGSSLKGVRKRRK